MAPRRLLRGALALAVATVTLGGVAWASGITARGGATVARQAVRAEPVLGDKVVAYDTLDVDAAVVEASVGVAARAGGAATLGRTGALGFQRVTRGGAEVHGAPAGFQIPLTYTSYPAATIAYVFGQRVATEATRLGDQGVVVNELFAGLTGAQTGDVVEVVTRANTVVPVVIAAVLSDTELGGAEFVMVNPVADRLGERVDTRVVIWGFESRAAVDREIAASGIMSQRFIRVRRSWDPPDPDSGISTLESKVALGEPWFRLIGTSGLEMHPVWKANRLIATSIPIGDSTVCDRRVVEDLNRALAAMNAAGLAGQLDAVNANSAGGCYNPRFSRNSWFLSRHAWATAIDFNTRANCQGCTPRMNCDVVRIFRRHGFVWGGNFNQPDGMHFEWAGGARDQIAYPSKYCPNLVAKPALGTAPTLGQRVLTVDTEGDG